MAELRLNPGTNPNIDPLEVRRVYRGIIEAADWWGDLHSFIAMTLHEFIEPAAFAAKNPTSEFAAELQKLVAAEYGSVRELYKARRPSFWEFLSCFLFHRRSHYHATRRVGARGFDFRRCYKCRVIKEIQ